MEDELINCSFILVKEDEHSVNTINLLPMYAICYDVGVFSFSGHSRKGFLDLPFKNNNINREHDLENAFDNFDEVI